MAPPKLLSAFISLTPTEPVLVFATSHDATHFITRCKTGVPSRTRPWQVYLPTPPGLKRVRTTRNGDVAFDFDSEKHATGFNERIRHLGTIYANPKEEVGWERTVYLGRELV